MKKEIIFMLVIALLGTGLVSAGSTESMMITADILPEEVSIIVPDNFVFPDIAPGYETKMLSGDKIYITNNGNVGVSVTMNLDHYFDDIFTNLKFGWLTGDRFDISNFTIDIERPDEIGEVEDSKSFYMRLDLTDYTGNVAENEHSTELVFTAVPN